MRPPRGTSSEGASGTPIYDSLYAEYRRLFRALPGDRTDEEELRFEGFGTRYGTGTGVWSGDSGAAPRAWGSASWHQTGPAQAALPPAPRDGHAYGL